MAFGRDSLLATWLPAVILCGALAAVAGAVPAPKEPALSQDQQIAKLVQALGDKDYAVRQRAEDELARIGFAAYEALTMAANHDDLEIAARARYLLRKYEASWPARKTCRRCRKSFRITNWGRRWSGPCGSAT